MASAGSTAHTEVCLPTSCTGGLDFSWVPGNMVLDSTTPKETFLFVMDIDF